MLLWSLLPACQPPASGVPDPAIDPPQFAQVSVGDLQSCGVLVDGRLGCWGTDPDEIDSWITEYSDERHGYHGDGHPPGGSSWRFVEMSGMASINGAGVSHSACALDVDGFVRCWGRTFPEPECAEPGSCWPEKPFVDIAVGHLDACGLDETGAVHCWGDEFGAGELVAANARGITMLNWTLNVLHEDQTHSRYIFGDGWGWTERQRQYADDDVGLGELRLVERSYNCVFSPLLNSVLCDPFDEPYESLTDGMRSISYWTPPDGSAWLSGYHDSFCSLSADGTAVCDQYVGSGYGASPGRLPGEFAQMSIRTGIAATGCAVYADGSLYCWGGIEAPTWESLRVAD